MLVDSHCHLDFPDFADELDDVVARARAAGVARMVTICTHVRKFEQVRAVAERFPDVFCSIGTHPHNADQELDIRAEDLIALATDDDKVVAIGEAGLDYFYQKASPEGQATGLRRHIEAARKTGLPLVIHSRDADQDMIEILTDEHGKGPFPAVLHCFSSGLDLALTGLSLGLYVSFSGIVTFKKSDALREIASKLPLDRVLVETDAPYLAPVPHRGQRNEPAYVASTAKVLAAHLGVDEDQFRNQTGENFFKLFSKVPRIIDSAPFAGQQDPSRPQSGA